MDSGKRTLPHFLLDVETIRYFLKYEEATEDWVRHRSQADFGRPGRGACLLCGDAAAQDKATARAAGPLRPIHPSPQQEVNSPGRFVNSGRPDAAPRLPLAGLPEEEGSAVAEGQELVLDLGRHRSQAGPSAHRHCGGEVAGEVGWGD